MTASDEKDRDGDKLRDVGKVREDLWAAERDRELLAKLRRNSEERAETDQRTTTQVFKRILCPLDFEENSIEALNLAGRLVSQNESDFYLLHVCSTVLVPLGGPVTDWPLAEQAAKHRIEEIAAQHLQKLRYQCLVTTGNVAERVTNCQLALDVDLIVMGTHGRRAVPHFFLGSVAERVVREAACPVLTIRAR